MNVLWLCNFMLPMVAERLGLEATNKEGWISGLASVLLERQKGNAIRLAVAFPVEQERDGYREELKLGEQGTVECFGFYEDTAHPERYDVGLEARLQKILEAAKPDVIHCFGTEYPHTLALCRAYSRKERILIGIQGLCAVYADAYFANLPDRVIRSATLRDSLRKDTLQMQQEKFVQRGRMEIEAVRLAGNVTGRTHWDRHYTQEWNPQAEYYEMNETLRKDFYDEAWKEENCVPHSIFLSQGDYPIKGLHYMLLALPDILKRYPDTKVYVAGNSVVKTGTLKDRIKVSAYGKYLQELLQRYALWDKVCFLGKLKSDEMKKQYLRSHLFVCCSTIENSPNSLGEAMLLGMPCVSALVGGISTIFQDGEDGIGYEGYDAGRPGEADSAEIAQRLSEAVLKMWDDELARKQYCEHARGHAKRTHDREANYRKLLEIYTSIAEK
ncbi:MAG: glycosyltransferase family 4 protein [Lachnospiraceae bacterium]|nr:glycosyltransferase family 4 protein [Lachnospiraceae bacterium]